MRNIKFIIIISAFLSLTSSFAQEKVELTIENQTVVGTDLFFDVYLKTTAASTGDYFLHDGDFILDFEQDNFTSATIAKVPNPSPDTVGFFIIQNGYCNFASTTYTDPSLATTGGFCQQKYYEGTEVTIKYDSLIIINLRGPVVSDFSSYDATIPKINGTASVHRLGRFKLSGISDPSGYSGLTWRNCTAGLSTKLFKLERSSLLSSILPCTDVTATDPASLVLPVEMATFNAEKEGRTSVLYWSTYTETNTSHFVVQRSHNGTSWSTIGHLDAAGNSISVQNYTFTDRSPTPSLNYYRLRIVDEDASFQYSEIRSVKFEGEFSLFTLSPNPVKEVLNLGFHLANSEVGQWQIVDLQGRIVKKTTENEFPLQSTEINVEDLAVGLYILVVSIEGERLTRKFVKQ